MTDANPYRDDFWVHRVKDMYLNPEFRTYVPERLRCRCGFETSQVLAAWVHGYVAHGLRKGVTPP
jgi:hypothetical protein